MKKRGAVFFYTRTRADRGKSDNPFDFPKMKEIQKHSDMPQPRRSPKRNSVGTAVESRRETMTFYPGSHPGPFPGTLTELRMMMEAKEQGRCPECGKKNCSCEGEEEESFTKKAKKTKGRRKAINKAKKDVFKKNEDDEDDESREKKVKAWMGESVCRTDINRKLGIQEAVKPKKVVQVKHHGIKENRWTY